MQEKQENKIAVCVSGGIDSTVSAFLLKQQGLDVRGIHFITGYEAAPPGFSPDKRARRISRLLDIEVRVADIREAFERIVVRDFVDTYLSGKTPNPCIVCNREIKFGLMLEYARKQGATRIATGHYARTGAAGNGRLGLKKGLDAAKDQSYFLAMLSGEQLASACFALGDRTKQEVRKIARENNIRAIYEKESQDICFVRGKSCQGFLASRINTAAQPGDIVDANGNLLGRHQGLFRYTIGQRRGINCPASRPYYVLDLDTLQNRLVVGFQDELYENRCYISGINWLLPNPGAPQPVTTRIRYRHYEAESVLTPIDDDRAVIDFQTPQPAVTPGQAAVCYKGEWVVAAGWIEHKTEGSGRNE